MQILTQMRTGVSVTKFLEAQYHFQSNLKPNADRLGHWLEKKFLSKQINQLEDLYEPPEKVRLKLTLLHQALKLFLGVTNQHPSFQFLIVPKYYAW